MYCNSIKYSNVSFELQLLMQCCMEWKIQSTDTFKYSRSWQLRCLSLFTLKSRINNKCNPIVSSILVL